LRVAGTDRAGSQIRIARPRGGTFPVEGKG